MKSLSLVAVITATCLFTSPTWAQPGGGRGFGGGGMRQQGIIGLLTNEAAHKEAGIAADGVEKLKSVAEGFQGDMQAAMQKMFPSGPPNFFEMSDAQRREMQTKMQEATKDAMKKFMPMIKDAISADQLKRLHQIARQLGGSVSMVDEEVANDLKLTDDQKKQIEAVNAEYGGKTRELFQGAFGGGGGDMAEIQSKVQKLNEERDSVAKELLNADQQKSWTEMLGKPADIAAVRASMMRGFGGGRGGPGGPGGGGPRGRPGQAPKDAPKEEAKK